MKNKYWFNYHYKSFDRALNEGISKTELKKDLWKMKNRLKDPLWCFLHRDDLSMYLGEANALSTILCYNSEIFANRLFLTP